MLLELRNLHVETDGKTLLSGINFSIGEGEVFALLGPNGSGKSTLAQVIAGNPAYHVSRGTIRCNGRPIESLSPEKRVDLGIALAYQNPPAVKGVSLSALVSLLPKTANKPHADILPEKMFSREVNVGFSGGEKKLSELLQVLHLRPRLAIFDEIDSGLDMKNIKKLTAIIQKELIAKGTAVLLITHSGHILTALAPTTTVVLLDGTIACQSKNYKTVIRTIQRYGYERCKKCPLLAR